jgi:hypothetical protein
MPSVEGWLLALCLILVVAHPAGIIYLLTANIFPAILKLHEFKHLVLLVFCLILYLGIGTSSVFAGIRLWLVKPGAVRFARRYLVLFVCAHFGYFALWYLLFHPAVISLSFARMVSSHIAGPLPFFFLWTSYLEHSKRVKATYGSWSAEPLSQGGSNQCISLKP